MKLYKFRAVNGDLRKDYFIEALINSLAIFSGRNNFNDLFDSRIYVPRPTTDQLEELLQSLKAHPNAAVIGGWISKGSFTANGVSALENMERAFAETIDSYPIYSLSSHNNSDLLWAHYASSHTGFCIEFDFPNAQPKQVSYREHIESICLLDFIKSYYSGIGGVDLGVRIHEALHVKLNHWSYEGEYRWIASTEMGRLPKGVKFIKIPYDPKWVKAIIFGCRTHPEVKAYIRNNIRFDTQFKQAVEVENRIEVVALVDS
jgi:hypothetical protein